MQVILFSFREFVLLEDDDQCQSAVFHYYDGDDGGKPPLKFCSSKLPNITRSSSNIVVFELHSSDQYSWSRFRIDYAAVHNLSDSSYPVIGAGTVVDTMYTYTLNMCANL